MDKPFYPLGRYRVTPLPILSRLNTTLVFQLTVMH